MVLEDQLIQGLAWNYLTQLRMEGHVKNLPVKVPNHGWACGWRESSLQEEG